MPQFYASGIGGDPSGMLGSVTHPSYYQSIMSQQQQMLQNQMLLQQ